MTGRNVRVLPQIEPEHGTNASYRRGCRCGPCRAAATAYMKAWRHQTGRTQRTREDHVAHLQEAREHGTYAMYKKAGCRCNVCRAFNAGYSMGYRHGSKERLEPWQEEMENEAGR